MAAKKNSTLRVLMFPWLAHGHISPMLELAKKLTKKNCYIYFCSTPVNLNSIKLSPMEFLSIQLVELHLPSLPDLPPHYHTTKGLPPHLMSTLKTAFDMSRSSFSAICKNLKPDLVVYDILQPWAPVVASSLGIPAVNFIPTSAGTSSYILHFVRKRDDNGVHEFPFPSIYLSDDMERHLDQVIERSRFFPCFELSSDIILVKTFKELEGKYLENLSLQLNKKIVPVGPLVREPTKDQVEKDQDEEVLMTEWLNKKEKSSTIFVSFGSEYFLSEEEREEVARGLELSKLNFIWVVRFPVGEKKNLEESLPKGYLERVRERGLVMEDWAPQAKILEHGSIGGFVSHCGWSSVMESMKFGVPIIAMPMHLDQPLNAKVVEDLQVGVEVRRKKSGGLDREEIANTIREVVVEKSGEGVRRKAREISDRMRKKGDEEIDEVVDEFLRLCHVK